MVHLNELQRYIFTEEYDPQMTREGMHELTFIESSGRWCSFQWKVEMMEVLMRVDAREFVKVIRELVKIRKKGRKH